LLSEVVSGVQVWDDDDNDNDKMTSVTVKTGQICLMYVRVVTETRSVCLMRKKASEGGKAWLS
jgi:hypothetical protein